MKQIVVVGGRGFVGKAVCESLLKNPNFHVSVAGRHPDDKVHCDLTKPETFSNLKTFDYIINCADNFQASPLNLMKYALENGLVMVECTADPMTIKSAIDSFSSPETPYLGSVILGAGLFPGLSNILARDVVASLHTKPTALKISIFISPLSQAGRSTCRLMAEHFCYQTLIIRKGKREISESLAPVSLNSSSRKHFTGLRLFFPEVVMMQKSLQLDSIETFLVPMPGFLSPIIARLRKLLSSSIFKGINVWFLKFLRNTLLGGKTSDIEILCIATGQNGETKESYFRTDDGLNSIASGVHVLVNSLGGKNPSRGLIMPDEVVSSWSEIEPLYNLLSPRDQKIR